MTRSHGRTTSPIAAIVVVGALLAAACTTGRDAASAVPASAPGASTPSASTPGSSTQPVASPALASATPSTSPTAAALTWTEASLEEDWPAPVRTEPAGPATIVPVFWDDGDVTEGSYADPASNLDPRAYPWVDIQDITFCRNKACPVVSVRQGPPHVDPTRQRVAYGLVEDVDGDGVADRRFGVDNIPGPLADGSLVRHRAWITDLHTGRTESSLLNADDHFESPHGNVYTPIIGDRFFGTTYPGPPVAKPRDAPCSGLGVAASSHDPAAIVFAFGGGESTNGGGAHSGGMPTRFYAWASTIVDGRVVATDYAPDVGWLHPSSKAPEADFQPQVEPPIDSIEEAIAAVGEADLMLSGFRPGDTQVTGAASWVEGEALPDGWDLTFVCDPNMEYKIFRGCPDGCGPIHATFHVARDGTVKERCEWQEGAQRPWRPKSGDHGVPGSGPSETEEPVPQAC